MLNIFLNYIFDYPFQQAFTLHKEEIQMTKYRTTGRYSMRKFAKAFRNANIA